MELSIAQSLIEEAVDISKANQVWADLGAGDGLFTLALAGILPQPAKIIAIDQDEKQVKTIRLPNGRITLEKIVADMNHLPADLPFFDGIIMANALHYIRDQSSFLRTIREKHLKSEGRLIVIEYDLEKSNPWVPFPVSRKKLTQLAHETEFDLQLFSNSVKSRLNSSEIYPALLKPQR